VELTSTIPTCGKCAPPEGAEADLWVVTTIRETAASAMDKSSCCGVQNWAARSKAIEQEKAGMTVKHAFDEELGRLLEMARQALPPQGAQYQPQQATQASSWPWQVPQLPARTSDHTPPSSA